MKRDKMTPDRKPLDRRQLRKVSAGQILRLRLQDRGFAQGMPPARDR